MPKVSGNNPDSLQMGQLVDFRMAKQKRATNSSTGIRLERKLSTALPAGYASILADVKARVRAAQLRAAVSVNRELIVLYWDLGKIIVEAQRTKGYGKQVVEQLTKDLHETFPNMAGFSPRNVWRMRAFYLAWTEEGQKHRQPVENLDSKILPQLVAELDGQNLPQLVAEIPWGHNVWLLEKIPNPILRLWYAHKVVEHGWSRAVLTHHIEIGVNCKSSLTATLRAMRDDAQKDGCTAHKNSQTPVVSERVQP